MVGVEAGQVAEPGLGAGGQAAAAVAVGAHRRPGGQQGVAKLVELGLLERLEPAGGVGVLVGLVGVPHGHAGGGEALVGPDRVQQALAGVRFLSLSDGTRCRVIFSAWPADLLHRDQADVRRVAGVEALVERSSLPGRG